MPKNIPILLLSIAIGTIFTLICVTVLILSFQSIILSHYGGFNLKRLAFIALASSTAVTLTGRIVLRALSSVSYFPKFIILLALSLVQAMFVIGTISLVLNYAQHGHLILEAFTFSLKNLTIYGLGLGLFLQWLFLRWKLKESKRTTPTKIIIHLCGMPLLASILFTFLSLTSLTSSFKRIPDAEVVIIPYDLESPCVRIFYDEACGNVLAEENDSLVYRIPRNGILIVQQAMASIEGGRDYYTEDTQGQRHKINKSSYRISHGFKTGQREKEVIPRFNGNFKLPHSVRYETLTFTLDHVSEEKLFQQDLTSRGISPETTYPFNRENLLRTFREKEDFRFDSLTVEVLNKCRGTIN